MVKEEYLKNGSLVRYYSDNNFTIRQIETGIEYSEAIDTVPPLYTYEESSNKIDEELLEMTDMLRALSLLGIEK